jgi:hypothetical protein
MIFDCVLANNFDRLLLRVFFCAMATVANSIYLPIQRPPLSDNPQQVTPTNKGSRYSTGSGLFDPTGNQTSRCLPRG